MMRVHILFLLLMLPSTRSTVEEPELTFERLYQYGKEAYTDRRWMDCIGFMRRALEDYEYYESEIQSCAKRCLKRLPSAPTFDETAASDFVTIGSLHFHSMRALCIMRCRREQFTGRRPALSRREAVHDFRYRKPYHYLQLCYFNDGDFDNAVRAAYTYLIANPGDKDAIDNLHFYMGHPHFVDVLLEDKLRSDYERMFISGVTAYEEEDWQKCVSHLDTTLEEFWKEEAKCRLSCRDRVEWAGVGSDSDIDEILASMYRSVVSCQHDCLSQLSWVNGHNFQDLVAQIFRYQHFCYFKLKRGQDAARAVSNHLMLDKSPDVRWNKQHYAEMYPGHPEIFMPDQKIVDFAKIRALEKKYLEFFEQRFVYLANGELPGESSSDYAALDDISVESLTRDDFPYASVSSLLSAELCTALRKAALQLPSPHESAVRSEAQSRLSSLFPSIRLNSLICGPLRRPSCQRAVVLSIERDSCSAWLGTVHKGCAIVACEQ